MPRSGIFSKRLSPPLTETCFQQGPFAPRALPRFFATMGLSDSRPGPLSELCLPLSRGPLRGHPAGSPRLLGCSFHARCPQPPRKARWVLFAVSSPPVAGFILVGRLAAFFFPNEAESGIACATARVFASQGSPDGLLRLALAWLHVERHTYMVNSFQFTRPTRITLVHRP